jgi:adenine phosphoribosyltransferase
MRTGTRVLVVDDLVATGGSALAACRLVERDGGVVAGAGFIVNLEFLGGRNRLEEAGYPVGSVIRVDSE